MLTLAQKMLRSGIVGDPITSGKEYERLANAAAEIDQVQKHFGATSRTVLVDASAIPAAYSSSEPSRFAFIHFTAHATASRLRPLDSAVVLSPLPEDPDSFKLYARDFL